MKVTSSSPCRLSLFGGGSDVNPYAQKYGGIVINMGINFRQRFDFEPQDTTAVDMEYHEKGNMAFYAAFTDKFDFRGKFTQKFDGLITAGMGSSAAAAVAMVGALARLTGQRLSKDQIAKRAWDIEVNDLGMYGGKQDQYASAYGGFNLMKFGRKVEVQSIHWKLGEWLKSNIVLIDTGIRRSDSKIQDNFKELTDQQKTALDLIKLNACLAVQAIQKKDLATLAELLIDSWIAKKLSNNVSSPEIEEIYQTALAAGALAGKICGAGQGGYMWFLCPPHKQVNLITALEETGCKWVPFEIDWEGLKVEVQK